MSETMNPKISQCLSYLTSPQFWLSFWRDFKPVLIAVVVVGLLAHGFGLTNANFNQDSLSIYQSDKLHQISIGRYLQFYYIPLRGHLVPPVLVYSLTFLFTALSAYLVIKTFAVERLWKKVAIASIFVVNYAVTLTAASCVHDSDIYSFALLFACFGVWVFAKGFKGSLIVMVLCFWICLGLYQAYLQVAVILLMAYFAVGIAQGTFSTVGGILKQVVRCLGSLLLALIIYYIGSKIAIASAGISLSDDYNSIAKVGFSSVGEIVSQIQATYAYTLDNFLHPRTDRMHTVARISVFLIAFFVLRLIQGVRVRYSKSMQMGGGRSFTCN